MLVVVGAAVVVVVVMVVVVGAAVVVVVVGVTVVVVVEVVDGGDVVVEIVEVVVVVVGADVVVSSDVLVVPASPPQAATKKTPASASLANGLMRRLSTVPAVRRNRTDRPSSHLDAVSLPEWTRMTRPSDSRVHESPCSPPTAACGLTWYPSSSPLKAICIYTAVDHKPKTTRRLQRLINIEQNPSVALLAEDYDEDWERLWWVRAEGVAVIVDARRQVHTESTCSSRSTSSTRTDGPQVL